VILVDTSVWIDHLRAGDRALIGLLQTGQALTHPFVIGEIALGSLSQRAPVLSALQDLPQAGVALDKEVLHFIDRNKLFGLGIGYVDAHLLAAAKLASGTRLWTRDKRLHDVARQLQLEAEL
jgi:predicted nucleic acid-binding protein